MNSYFQLIKIGYTSLSLVKWLAVIGVLFYCLMFFIDDPKANLPLSMLTVMLSLAIPFFCMASTFGVLIANRRFFFVPGFHLKAGLSLLAFTLFFSTFPAINIALFDEKLKSPLLPFVYIFTFSSIYIFVAQKIISAKNPQILSWLMIVGFFIFFVLGKKNEGGLKLVLMNEIIISILFLLSIIGWVLALRVLSIRSVFNSNSILKFYRSADAFSIEGQNEDWGSFPKFHNGSVSTPEGTLMRAAYDDLKTCIFRIAYFTLFMPFTFGGVLAFTYGNGNFIEGYIFMTLLLLAVTTTFAGLSASEWVARMRYLWLRGSCNRQTLWRILEKQLMQTLLISYIFSFTLAAILFYFSSFTKMDYLNFIFLVISISIFFSYFSIYYRIKKSNGLLFGGIIVFAIVIIISIVISISRAEFGLINFVEGCMLIISYILHVLCAKSFNKIDWIMVKPTRRLKSITE